MALGLEADLTTALTVVKDSQLPSEEEGRFLYKEFFDMPTNARRSVMYPGFSNSESDSMHAHGLYLDDASRPGPDDPIAKKSSVKHLSEAFHAIKQPHELEDTLQLAM